MLISHRTFTFRSTGSPRSSFVDVSSDDDQKPGVS